MWNLICRLMKNTRTEQSPAAQADVDLLTRDLALYHFESCPFCRRVRRTIKRLNINIPLRDIRRSPEFREELINGGGKKTVPCLRIDEGGTHRWLYESDDIIDYLNDRFRNA